MVLAYIQAISPFVLQLTLYNLDLFMLFLWPIEVLNEIIRIASNVKFSYLSFFPDIEDNFARHTTSVTLDELMNNGNFCV